MPLTSSVGGGNGGRATWCLSSWESLSRAELCTVHTTSLILQLTKRYCRPSDSSQRLRIKFVSSFIFTPTFSWLKSSDLEPLSGMSSRSFCVWSLVSHMPPPQRDLPEDSSQWSLFIYIWFSSYMYLLNYVFIYFLFVSLIISLMTAANTALPVWVWVTVPEMY